MMIEATDCDHQVRGLDAVLSTRKGKLLIAAIGIITGARNVNAVS